LAVGFADVPFVGTHIIHGRPTSPGSYRHISSGPVGSEESQHPCTNLPAVAFAIEVVAQRIMPVVERG